mgnify:CR=1 FL=1
MHALIPYADSLNEPCAFAPLCPAVKQISAIIVFLSGFAPRYTFDLPARLSELRAFADPVQVRYFLHVEGFSRFEFEDVLCSFLVSHRCTPFHHSGQLVIVAIGKSATETALIVMVPLLVSGRVYP